MNTVVEVLVLGAILAVFAAMAIAGAVAESAPRSLVTVRSRTVEPPRPSARR
ncbi:hypothetical protein [Nocardia veterana]|uniref:Uncharacterized protein n=1 Tax=Nocardia veterana TaxID=132249 RepID=A0A7X6M284_9NOCA|nr:hypothetical protein [Nocardia veterana]NKY88918.1 hypothetical protein [Nocardia veterana]